MLLKERGGSCVGGVAGNAEEFDVAFSALAQAEAFEERHCAGADAAGGAEVGERGDCFSRGFGFEDEDGPGGEGGEGGGHLGW